MNKQAQAAIVKAAAQLLAQRSDVRLAPLADRLDKAATRLREEAAAEARPPKRKQRRLASTSGEYPA